MKPSLHVCMGSGGEIEVEVYCGGRSPEKTLPEQDVIRRILAYEGLVEEKRLLADALRELYVLAAPFHRDTDPMWRAAKVKVLHLLCKATSDVRIAPLVPPETGTPGEERP